MAAHEHPSIRGSGRLMLGALDGKGTLAGEIRGSLDLHLKIWDDPGLRAATARSSIPLHLLRKTPITVYVEVPFEQMEAFGPFLRTFFTGVVNLLSRSKPEPDDWEVWFLLDEFPAMGAVPHLVKSMSYMAGYGVRLWLFIQKLSQLQGLYPDTWRGILDDTEAKFFMDVREPETLEMLSKWLGNSTVAYEAFNSSENLNHEGNGSLGASVSVQFTGRPIATPDELLELLSKKRKINGKPLGAMQLNLISGMRPFCTARPYYFLVGHDYHIEAANKRLLERVAELDAAEAAARSEE